MASGHGKTEPSGYGKTLILVDQVEARSNEKHPNDDWREMTATYICKKIFSHLIKWFIAGRGTRFNGDGAHHLAKIIWYIQRWFWIEDNRPQNDDRPIQGRTKGVQQFIINLAKTVFDL